MRHVNNGILLKIGRNCHMVEYSAEGNDFSTSTYSVDAHRPRSESVVAKLTVHRSWMLFSSVLVLAIVAAPGVFGQLPPLQTPPPGWGQVPQGTGACSVEKSCADLAPEMIQKALGRSPLESEIRELSQTLSGRNSSGGMRTADWVAKAFRGAGADEVHTEKLGAHDPFASVVAQVRGREHPDEYVLLVGPLDIERPGRAQNADNVAVLIDAVRVLHTSGSIPRRSIRFVVFAEEPNSVNGRSTSEWAYIRAHYRDLDKIEAVVAINAAGSSLDGFSLGDRPEMLPAVRDALAPLTPIGIRNFTEALNLKAPLAPFWLMGIPTLEATSEPGVERQGHAGSSPAASRPVQLQRLKRGVAVAAITAYALADSEARIGTRRSRVEVERSIRSQGLEPQLKSIGLWSKWQSTDATGSH